MESHSIWDINYKNEKELKKNYNDNNLDTDILIIGGGITGVTTAYFLMNQNKKIMLIDKSKIGMGVTSKTTAKLNYLQGTIYQDLEKRFDIKTSKHYFDSQKDAINLILNIINKEKIKCDLEKCDSFIFTKEQKNISKIKKEMNILKSWDIKCSEIDKLPIDTFPILSGIVVGDTYTFHPLKYVKGLEKVIRKKISIYEDTVALEIRKENDYYTVLTNYGITKAKTVIVCCHYPFFINPLFIPIKTYIKREYVNAAKYLEIPNFTAISIDDTLNSIRFYDDYLIYGSNQQRLTNKIEYRDNYEKSKIDFKRYFSKEPEFTWMNQDIMSNDKLPFIGEIKNHKNLFIATAYNAWGMTNGTIAAKVISDLIITGNNKYKDIFNPNRINKTVIGESLIGALHYSKVYIQTTIKKNPVFYNDYVYIIKINGKYYGVYFDNYGKKHIVNQKCPHMKCNLIFNDYEKTWDCPCHGSRFDIDGNVLEGPANYSINTNFEKN